MTSILNSLKIRYSICRVRVQGLNVYYRPLLTGTENESANNINPKENKNENIRI